MQSAISLLNANSGTAQDKEVFEPATNIAPNSNHIQQLNKRETHERDGQNQQEMKRKQQKQEDDEKNIEPISWNECEICGLWVHE